MLSDYLVVARVARPQGIRGELKLEPLTNDPSRFEDLKTVYVRRGDTYVPYGFTFKRTGSGAVYASLSGVEDRTAAEALRGAELCVDREHAVRLGPDQDFICDLIGLRAFDSDGKELGTLTEVMQPGSADVYVLKRGRLETLVPALRSVVKEIDYARGVIVFDSARLKEVSVTNEG